jgi:hypothetical protein
MNHFRAMLDEGVRFADTGDHSTACVYLGGAASIWGTGDPCHLEFKRCLERLIISFRAEGHNNEALLAAKHLFEVSSDNPHIAPTYLSQLVSICIDMGKKKQALEWALRGNWHVLANRYMLSHSKVFALCQLSDAQKLNDMLDDAADTMEIAIEIAEGSASHGDVAVHALVSRLISLYLSLGYAEKAQDAVNKGEEILARIKYRVSPQLSVSPVPIDTETAVFAVADGTDSAAIGAPDALSLCDSRNWLSGATE